MSDLEPPAGLEASGMRLWSSVVDVYVLTASEVAILAQACYTADELDRLEAAVRELPELTVRGSTGQIKPHPLLGEVRQHRALLRQLVESMNLPDQSQEFGLRAGARHARKAAAGRWSREAAG